jgi:serine/threonine-protein phosphatase with EF-hand domain
VESGFSLFRKPKFGRKLILLLSQIFNDIDVQDEGQMLMLANFMQTLIDHQIANPVVKEILGDTGSLTKSPNPTLDLSAAINMEDIHIADMTPSLKQRNIRDYTLPKGIITEDMIIDIINLYRQGGKLNVLSAQNILRQAYKSLKKEPNIVQVNITEEDRVVVVGDLHGQLNDLLFILDESGIPSGTTKYIFNGDFVDRGPQSIEVIILLLALYSAFPGSVFLNRGNHEDYAVCCVYGFQREAIDKYDEVFFGMFCEIFNYLPICSIINNSVLVIHGGLFHDVDVKLSDVEEIDRKEYRVHTDSAQLPTSESFRDRQEYLNRLFRDALWSDPHCDDELKVNGRGSGVLFGPQHTKAFLTNNDLDMVIRSHECVPNGFDFPFRKDSNPHMLCTVFSASNYGGSGNSAAYIVFTTHAAISESKRVARRDLYFSTKKFSTLRSSESMLEDKNKVSLMELMRRRKRALELHFESADTSGTGLIAKWKWSEIMQKVTGLKILWLPLVPVLMPASCLEGQSVKYKDFLKSLGAENLTMMSFSQSDISAMYGPIEQLELIFRFFDKDGDGSISREEFKLGCEALNQQLPAEDRLDNYDAIMSMIDLDGSDSIDKNELFEVCIFFCSCVSSFNFNST